MIALIQRVTEASVVVGGATLGEIGPGICALVAVEQDDRSAQAERLAERVLAYRIFADDRGRMNRSLLDTGGALLAVSQFTLAADTGKGLRASFSRAAPPEAGRRYFDAFVEAVRARGVAVATGQFGADMQVALVNDGPVTFWLTA